jgi:hypothetical protein
MRGYAEEMFYFIVIFLAIFMLFVFFNYQRGTKGAEVKKTVEERNLVESGNSAIFSIFDYKLPFIEKAVVEVAIDALLQGIHFRNKNDLDKVFYGAAIGKANATEIIEPILDNFAKGRWKIEIITTEGKFVYGNIPQSKIIYTFVSPIPIPHEKMGQLILSIG